MRTVLGDENQVRMCDPIPMYDHSDALRLKHLHHSTPDVLRHTHDALGGTVLDVSKMVDMRKRNHGALTGRGGMDCHEGDYDLVPIDDTGGWRSRDGGTEQAGQGPDAGWMRVHTRIRDECVHSVAALDSGMWALTRVCGRSLGWNGAHSGRER